MLPGNPKFINQDEFCPGFGGQSWYGCWTSSWRIAGHNKKGTQIREENSITEMFALWKSSEWYQCLQDKGALYKGTKRRDFSEDGRSQPAEASVQQRY